MRTRPAGNHATGRRRPFATRLRSTVLKNIRRVEYRLSRSEAPGSLRLSPDPRTAGETSDVAGRLNWFLPAGARNLPLLEPKTSHRIGPEHAAYLDPPLVTDPGWLSAESRPPGRSHSLIHRLTLASAMRMLRQPRDFTFIDPAFAFGSDEEFFRLAQRFCTVACPTAEESFARMIGQRSRNGKALVLATGPSADLLDPSEFAADLRMTCNSAIRDRALMDEMRPNLIAFSDPVFHFGPSRYAAEFRRDLRHAIDSSDALFITSSYFVAPLLVAMPEIADRIAIFDLKGGIEWCWPTEPGTDLRTTGNVLTNLMLPIACALATEIRIGGCDGRNPNENYFWKHNPARQYDDDLMGSAFDAHPGFFKYRIYEDYYETHCRELASLITKAEAEGRKVVSVTPSHIPALASRAA